MDRPTAPQLEPLRFGDLVDAGFRLWRKGFGQFFLVAVVFTLPVGVIGWLLERTQVVGFDSGIPVVKDPDQYSAIVLIVGVLGIAASFISTSAVLVISTVRAPGKCLASQSRHWDSAWGLLYTSRTSSRAHLANR